MRTRCKGLDLHQANQPTARSKQGRATVRRTADSPARACGAARGPRARSRAGPRGTGYRQIAWEARQRPTQGGPAGRRQGGER